MGQPSRFTKWMNLFERALYVSMFLGFLHLFFFPTFGSLKKLFTSYEAEFIERVEAAVKETGSNHIPMKTLTPFSWDKVCYLPPYSAYMLQQKATIHELKGNRSLKGASSLDAMAGFVYEHDVDVSKYRESDALWYLFFIDSTNKVTYFLEFYSHVLSPGMSGPSCFGVHSNFTLPKNGFSITQDEMQ